MCLKVDGSSRGNPRPADFGGLVRNDMGGFIVGFSGSVGFYEILQAELLAIFHGLQISWERGFKQVVLYSDSMLALGLVRVSWSRFHLYVALLRSIQLLLQKPWQVVLNHILREGNALS